MAIWCSDYRWEEGIPQAVSPGRDFFLLDDPYGRRWQVEAYKEGHFDRLVYDSRFLDFRKLTPREQLGWLREEIGENLFLLRDRDHSPVLIEMHLFEKGLCYECRFFSPHRVPLGHQKILYEKRGDPFNGAVLYDVLNKPVLAKRYRLTAEEEFGELIDERKVLLVDPLLG